MFRSNVDKVMLAGSVGLFLGCLLVTLSFPIVAVTLTHMELSDS